MKIPTLSEGLDKFNSTLKYYKVQPAMRCVGEDGKYHKVRAGSESPVGYEVQNKEFGIVEHTTMFLPAAIFQATHLEETLTSLINSKHDLMSVIDMPTDDVVPN